MLKPPKQKCSICKTLNVCREFVKHPSETAWRNVESVITYFSKGPFCPIHLIKENELVACNEIEIYLEHSIKMAEIALRTGKWPKNILSHDKGILNAHKFKPSISI